MKDNFRSEFVTIDGNFFDRQYYILDGNFSKEYSEHCYSQILGFNHQKIYSQQSSELFFLSTINSNCLHSTDHKTHGQIFKSEIVLRGDNHSIQTKQRCNAFYLIMDTICDSL